jgi:hypothetical protein
MLARGPLVRAWMRAAFVTLCGGLLVAIGGASAQSSIAAPAVRFRELSTASSVRFTVSSPSMRVTAANGSCSMCMRGPIVGPSCPPACTIAPDWWEGPGRYVLSAETDHARDDRELVLRGDEEAVWVTASGDEDRLELAVAVHAADPRVRVRIAEGGVVEVVNESDHELEVTLQDGGVHWSWEPDDPWLSADERDQARESSRHPCGMGITPRTAWARTTTRLVPLHRGGPRGPGHYVGSITLRVVGPRPQPDAGRVLLARFSFDVDLRPDGTLRLRARGHWS